VNLGRWNENISRTLTLPRCAIGSDKRESIAMQIDAARNKILSRGKNRLLLLIDGPLSVRGHTQFSARHQRLQPLTQLATRTTTANPECLNQLLVAKSLVRGTINPLQ
jgi:hypothetical protein